MQWKINENPTLTVHFVIFNLYSAFLEDVKKPSARTYSSAILLRCMQLGFPNLNSNGGVFLVRITERFGLQKLI